VTREPYLIGSQEVSNYFIERRGTSRPNETVILGAHIDTIPITPGADDNASAVAALLEVARLLHDVPTARTVRFVAFACEEAPHFSTDTMGSQHHARACRKRGERISAMVCLEMLGYYCTEHGSQRLPDTIPRWLGWLFPRRGDFLASVANPRSIPSLITFHRGFRRASSLRLFSIALPESIREIRMSDNSSFWDQHYPALMITDTSFLRNPHYHQPTDTPDTLDYTRMTQATLGVAAGVAKLAGATTSLLTLPRGGP